MIICRVTGTAGSSSLPRILCLAPWRTFGGWCGTTMRASLCRCKQRGGARWGESHLDSVIHHTSWDTRTSCLADLLLGRRGGGALCPLASKRSKNLLWPFHRHAEEWRSYVFVQWGRVGDPQLHTGIHKSTLIFAIQHIKTHKYTLEHQTLFLV